MYTEINAAIQAAKVIYEIVKANKELANFNELVTAVSEVNAKLLVATSAALTSQEKQSLLSERVRELEKKIMEFENWESTRQNYELKNLGSGIFAYVYKPTVDTHQERHWACIKCFQDQKLSILQRQLPPLRNGYLCNNCNALITPIGENGLASIDEAY